MLGNVKSPPTCSLRKHSKAPPLRRQLPPSPNGGRSVALSDGGCLRLFRLMTVPGRLLLVDLEQLDLKRQLRVGRNRVPGPPCAVAELRRDDKLPLAADLHP